MFTKKNQGVDQRESLAELSRKIDSVITEVAEVWENRLAEAQKSGDGVDMLGITTEIMRIKDKKNAYFIEHEQRCGL